MALSEIIEVSIQAGTVSPARRGFGVPLIMARHAAWSGTEVRRYTAFSQVAEDFDSHEWPYLAAAELFAQRPRPPEIKIGRLPTPGSNAQTNVLDFTDHPSGTAITGTVTSPAGVETAINVAWNTNIGTTLAAVDTAIEAAIGASSVTTASPLLTIVTPIAGEGVAHFEFPTAYARETTADQDYDDALTAHAAVDGDFFYVLADTGSPKNIDKIARWALSNGRVYVTSPQYGDPSDFVSGEFSAGADFTALQANNNAVGLITKQARSAAHDAGWVGRMAPFKPGAAAWAYKTIAGAGADAWTTTQRLTQIETNAKANHYTTEARVAVTRPGKAFGGEWIDVTIGLEWMTARFEEELFTLLANEPKVPYTTAGFGQIENVMRGVLREAERAGVIDSGWEITILPVSEQTTGDRAARIADGLEFSARLAGAIYKARVVGTVTV